MGEILFVNPICHTYLFTSDYVKLIVSKRAGKLISNGCAAFAIKYRDIGVGSIILEIVR